MEIFITHNSWIRDYFRFLARKGLLMYHLTKPFFSPQNYRLFLAEVGLNLLSYYTGERAPNPSYTNSEREVPRGCWAKCPQLFLSNSLIRSISLSMKEVSWVEISPWSRNMRRRSECPPHIIIIWQPLNKFHRSRTSGCTTGVGQCLLDPLRKGGKAFPSELLSPSLHPCPHTLFKDLSKSLVPMFKNQTKTNHFLNIQQSIYLLF